MSLLKKLIADYTELSLRDNQKAFMTSLKTILGYKNAKELFEKTEDFFLDKKGNKVFKNQVIDCKKSLALIIKELNNLKDDDKIRSDKRFSYNIAKVEGTLSDHKNKLETDKLAMLKDKIVFYQSLNSLSAAQLKASQNACKKYTDLKAKKETLNELKAFQF